MYAIEFYGCYYHIDMGQFCRQMRLVTSFARINHNEAVSFCIRQQHQLLMQVPQVLLLVASLQCNCPGSAPERSVAADVEMERVPNPAFSVPQDDVANPVTPRDQLLPQQGPPVLPQRDVVGLQQDSVVVDGVALTAESSIASLRAGCKHVGISQSGSRSKLFRRLVSHFEQKQLEVIYATHPLIPTVQPNPQMLAVAPVDFETISKHELSHLPYEPWCPSCVANKARPEAHFTNPAKQIERSIRCCEL